MGRMAVNSTEAIRKASDRVARSALLMDRQEATIRALERSGADTRLACALLYTMYRSRLLMIEYLDQLKGVGPVTCEPAACPQAEADVHEHPQGSVDDWLQLLTLAMNPHQGPHGAH